MQYAIEDKDTSIKFTELVVKSGVPEAILLGSDMFLDIVTTLKMAGEQARKLPAQVIELRQHEVENPETYTKHDAIVTLNHTSNTAFYPCSSIVVVHADERKMTVNVQLQSFRMSIKAKGGRLELLESGNGFDEFMRMYLKYFMRVSEIA